MGVMVKDGLGPAGPGGGMTVGIPGEMPSSKSRLRFLAVCRAGMEKFIMFLQRDFVGDIGQDTELSKKSKEKGRLCIGYVERSVRKLHLTAGLSHLLFFSFLLVLKGSPLARKLIILSCKTQDGQSEFRAS